MKKPGPKPRIINTAWTSDLAYVVGIFASDGNLGNDGMYLNVTSKDKEMLVNVLTILHQTHIKIGEKMGGYGTQAYQIQFKSVVLYKWFISIGLTPNKSKTINTIKVPDKYFFDFLRGVWDGDGSIYSFWDTRWRSSFMFYISFASSSNLFLKWLQKTTLRLLNIHGTIATSKNSSVQHLRFAKKDSILLFDKMFSSNDPTYLTRKFTKAKKIFTINKRNTTKWK